MLHLSPLAPGLSALVARKREYWLVALAFFVSALGEVLPMSAWEASYYWLPIQIGLVIAYLTAGNARRVLLGAFVVVAYASSLISAPGPEWMMTLYAAGVVGYLASGPLKWSLITYFGLGGLGYMWLLLNLGGDLAHAVPYQGSRLAAYGLFIGSCFKEEI